MTCRTYCPPPRPSLTKGVAGCTWGHVWWRRIWWPWCSKWGRTNCLWRWEDVLSITGFYIFQSKQIHFSKHTNTFFKAYLYIFQSILIHFFKAYKDIHFLRPMNNSQKTLFNTSPKLWLQAWKKGNIVCFFISKLNFRNNFGIPLKVFSIVTVCIVWYGNDIT